VDEVCEVVTLSEDDIEPVTPNSADAKSNFISGIGKKGDTLISLFEINSIVEEKESN
jgi:purine-binding chemotaxis protein CheW